MIKKKKTEETVTLSKEQFDTLLNEINSLKTKVQELSTKSVSQKPPVFYSGGNSLQGKEMRTEEKKEKVLSGEKMTRAIDLVIEDFRKNPPRRI